MYTRFIIIRIPSTIRSRTDSFVNDRFLRRRHHETREFRFEKERRLSLSFSHRSYYCCIESRVHGNCLYLSITSTALLSISPSDRKTNFSILIRFLCPLPYVCLQYILLNDEISNIILFNHFYLFLSRIYEYTESIE